ncbi:MAG TPA: copper resistance protein B [Allosphingosinicella sp.]
MTRLLIALLATTAASPALAQHGGHAQPPAAPAAPTCTPEHAAMGHCTMPPAPAPAPAPTCTAEHAAMGHCTLSPTPAPAPAPAPASTCTAEHAAMGHCTMPQPTPAPAPAPICTAEHAAMGHCTMEQQPATDPHAGHSAPAEQADPHAGHQMTGDQAAPPAPPVGPPPPAAFSGPEHAADTVFGAGQMAPSRREMIRMHGRMTTSRLRAERLEVGFSGGEESYAWEADFFTGEPLDRLWIKTEGEGAFGGDLEHGEVQALWGHAISPFFDLQAGVRYDFAPDPQRGHLVLGVQGLAPYWIEVDAAAFLSDEGELTARIEAEYDLRITQRLILQPLVEVALSAQDIPELGIGAGLSTSEAGLRLRYEIVPEFAPYVGVEWEQAYGQTADFREAAGEEAGSVRFVAGVRLWF